MEWQRAGEFKINLAKFMMMETFNIQRKIEDKENVDLNMQRISS